MAKTVTVSDGGSIDSVAFEEGFAPETLWRLPENANLHEGGRKRTVLKEGDSVHVPDKRVKTETRETDQVHRFRRKGVPALFTLRYLIAGKPISDHRWTLRVAGREIHGRTDAQGELQARVPPNVTTGSLSFDGMADIALNFGRLEPVETHRGAAQRLVNLGYSLRPEDEREATERFSTTLAKFQANCGLPATGVMDDDTQAALIAAHEPG